MKKALLLIAIVAFLSNAHAQSGAVRPRRVSPTGSSNATGASANNASSAPTVGEPRLDTTRAYTLLQQKQYEAALAEARRITVADPQNAEAWKIAGFAELSLKRFKEAADDLQRAYDLQRAAGEEDVNTRDALAQALVRSEQFEKALPLLVAATTRPSVRPDAGLLYYRGLAEFRTGKIDEARRSFEEVIKLEPRNSAALFYLGRIAQDKKDLNTAITMLNRATQSDPQLAEAWTLLTVAYLQRASSAANETQAKADYANAARAGESLYRLKTDAASALLYGQALIYAEQYARAVPVLERATNLNAQDGTAFYFLGIAQSRLKNFPQAIVALERAATISTNDANIYRELGYAYEASKQYAKALAAYEKGLSIAPNDADLKESAERVRPFAK